MWRKRFFLAISFLTVIPIPELGECSCEDIKDSMVFFPLVGCLIGLLLIITSVAVSPLFSPNLVNLLVVFVLFLLTGGLHHDGLADMADAIGSGKDKETMLDIMRDSRTGAMGVCAVFFSAMFFWQLLNELDGRDRTLGMICACVVGRSVQVLLADKLPYARQGGGTGAVFVNDNLRPEGVSLRFCVAMLSIFFVFSMYSMSSMALNSFIVLLLVYIWGKYLVKKFGGVTGDCLGASNEMAQIMVLLLIVMSKG